MLSQLFHIETVGRYVEKYADSACPMPKYRPLRNNVISRPGCYSQNRLCRICSPRSDKTTGAANEEIGNVVALTKAIPDRFV